MNSKNMRTESVVDAMVNEWIIKDKVARYVPKGEPFICMFSSGKDSVLALSKACEYGGIPVGLIYCDSEEDVLSEYVFHWQSIQNVNLQAEVMGIPIEHHDGLWYKWDKTIKKSSYNVNYIVFGDLNLMDNLKIQSIICEKNGLIPCFPRKRLI